MDQEIGGRVAGAEEEARRIDAALGRLAPGLAIAEELVVEGIATQKLLGGLRSRVCPGALPRSTETGWALDWPEAGTAVPFWRGMVPLAERGLGPQFPTDEQAATCLRLADALALALGLGRGHVFPLFENPARRAIEMQAFCDLPSLAEETVQARVAAFLDLGVPVGAVLGLRFEGGRRWSGFQPALRWGKVLLSPQGEGLRPRMPEEFWPASEFGYGLVLFRPLAEGLAVGLPGALALPALAQLLARLEEVALVQGAPLLVEGELAVKGLLSLTVAPAPDGIRLGLPALRGVAESGAFLDSVTAAMAVLGGRVRPGGRRLAFGSAAGALGAATANLVAASLRHPALTRLRHGREVGPYSGARRADERPGDVGESLRRLLGDPAGRPALSALSVLLETTEWEIAGERLILAGEQGERASGHLLAAAAAVPWPEAAPALPLAAYALPAILAVDLDVLLARLAKHGLELDPAPPHAALARLCPLLLRQEAGGVALELRRALLDRRLPGPWQAAALEVRLTGAAEGAAVSVDAGGGPAALPLAAFGDLRLGRLTLPLEIALTGPCAGLFPPNSIGLSIWREGAARASFRLRPAAGWEGLRVEHLQPPATPPPAPAAAGLDHPGLFLGR
ncbi:MAG TPA: hypothetical protein VFR34_08910 [Paracoccaceae bacterium]|nr:hypothetical protein [Paracoccaceae bacterium]